MKRKSYSVVGAGEFDVDERPISEPHADIYATLHELKANSYLNVAFATRAAGERCITNLVAIGKADGLAVRFKSVAGSRIMRIYLDGEYV